VQHIHADLRGDGRQLVHPRPTRAHVYVGTPKRVPLRIARIVVAAFQRAGASTHSPAGELCWIVQDWCTENSVGLDVVQWIERDTRPNPITPILIRGYTCTRVERRGAVSSQRYIEAMWGPQQPADVGDGRP